LPPHRLQTQALPSLGAPTRQRPSLPEGAEARSIAAAGDALVFRLHVKDGAEAGGHRAGIYRQRVGVDTLELLAPDEGGAVLLEPQLVGDVVILKRSLPAGAPSTSAEIVFARPGAAALVIAGQEVSVSADGSTAAVVDSQQGLSVVELRASTLHARHVAALEIDDAQRAPLPALTGGGESVLVTQRAALSAIDTTSGAARELLPPSSQVVGHLAAAVADDEAVVLVSSRDDDGPSGELVRVTGGTRTTLWRTALAQPHIAPGLFGDYIFAALTLEPFGSASYGPVQLVVLPLAGGAHAAVLELAAGPLRLRVTAGELLVEGGEELLRFRLPAD
jgi:hypothetical protein